MPIYARSLVSLSLTTLLLAASGCSSHLDAAHEALAIGDEPKAEHHLRKALKSGATKKEAGRQLSILLAEQGNGLGAKDPRAAENLYMEALELDASNEDARLGLARLLIKRGFMKDAEELLDVEGCRGCDRLSALMMHDKGVAHLQAGEIDIARQIFQEAFTMGGDPLDGLALVETWLLATPPDLKQAHATLIAATPLIARGQTQPEAQFRELRNRLLFAAAAAHQTEMVDQLLELRTAELAEEPEFELRFKVSQEQFRAGDSDPAIGRISNLLDKSGQYIDPTLRNVMSSALVVMYSARVAQSLQKGDPVGAAKDIVAGLKIEPDHSRLKLQQILAIAGNRLDLAFTQLAEQGKSADVDKVTAILHSLDAIALVEAGDVPKALIALEKAEAKDDDLPEVHLARAYVLAEQRNEDLKKKDLQDARATSAFSYPGGRVNQYAAALAHLDRARSLIVAQGVLYPWRGAGFDGKAEALRAKIKAFYPYEVTWYEGKGGLLELTAEAGQKDVEVSGPRWLKVTAIASPGKPAEVEVPNVGLVLLGVDGKQIGVIVEPHAHIKVAM
ncbi:tetratricopeptide repeat protein [Nannocystaceae bacterium ST9]